MKGTVDHDCSSQSAVGARDGQMDVGKPWRGGQRGRESNPDGGVRRARHRRWCDHRGQGDGQGKLDQPQLKPVLRHGPRGWASFRQRVVIGEEGSVVEAAIAIPAAMLVILLAVQVCLWAHASTLVQAAATRGDQAACVENGSLTSGIAEARLALADTAHQVVVDASVQASLMSGDEVQLRVTGVAESIVPGVHLAVSAVRVGSRQEFRVGN